MSLKRALIVDHDDSFIWNIKFWLQPEFNVSIVNHKDLHQLKEVTEFDLIIMSPGPKSPYDYPNSLQFLKTTTQPVLGICLGFQMLTVLTGGEVLPYAPPLHGKTSTLSSNHLKVARYHSLKCIPTDEFKIKAVSEDDHCIMWVEHKHKKQIGFQFHPESFLTESSAIYKNYILEQMMLWNQ